MRKPAAKEAAKRSLVHAEKENEYRRNREQDVRVANPIMLQIYEISLNVSKGSLDSSEEYGQLRWDKTSVRVQVRGY